VEVILLVDIGSTYTKVTAVDIKNECILGTGKAFTTVETDINEGLEKAIESLNMRARMSKYSEIYACSSAAGGLKMVAVGLVPVLTAQAAKMAALSAGAKVLKTYSYELSSSEAKEIFELKPDILLLSGGTNGGNSNVIIHNAGVIAGIDLDFPVVVAGNKSAGDKIAALLSKTHKEVRLCENVMPDFNVLNIEPAREIIREIFLQRIIKAKGLTRVQELVEGILMPTPSAVLKAAYFLSEGWADEQGLDDLMVVDVGGATTDVYTINDGSPTYSGAILKGLPEPFDKRTVEGDLGVRYNITTLLETAGMESIVKKSGLTRDEILYSTRLASENPGILPSGSNKIEQLDTALAAMAVKIAVERHAGRLESVYTPFGAAYIQTGKDLSGISKIIGTGGPVINCSNPAEILNEAMHSSTDSGILKPVKAQFMLDKKYILAAMGLLCVKYPKIAVRIMKKELEMI
jgi:uncharacterized protein (TIGR01319 family)